jgi:hypothetical protein
MSGEKTLIMTHNHGDYGTGERTEGRLAAAMLEFCHCLRSHRWTVQALLHLLLHVLAIVDLDQLHRLAGAILRSERSFEHCHAGWEGLKVRIVQGSDVEMGRYQATEETRKEKVESVWV